MDYLVRELNNLSLEGPVVCDTHLKQDVMVIAPVIGVICDNPRASEIFNHAGSSAKHYCRMGMVCTGTCLTLYAVSSIYSLIKMQMYTLSYLDHTYIFLRATLKN